MKQVKRDGVITMGYRYNARGERVAAINGDSGPVTTYTLYDEAGQWIGDYDGTGATIQQVIWMDNLPVGLLDGVGTAQRLKYIESDHLGTPRAVVDPNRGTTGVAIWTWDAKGEAFGNSPPNQDPDQDGTAFVFNMRFPGQRYDPSTGLSYNYFRDYDPSTGRFLQSDPIGLGGGASTYGYVRANPLMSTDPYGLQDDLQPLVPINGQRTDIYRPTLEAQMVRSGSLSDEAKRHLDRGCIGLTSVYQQMNVKIPENAPGTQCYVTQPQAEAAANCKNPFIFAKQGHWTKGRPTPDADGRIPNNAVGGGKYNPGYFNYVTYFKSTDSYAWMNYETQSNQSANPQRATISPEPPSTYAEYPQEMWCFTCATGPKPVTSKGGR